MRRYTPYVAAACVLLALVLASGPIKRKYFDPPPVPSQPVLAQADPICQFVEKMGLRCLASPSAESLMGPGRYVKYVPTTRDAKVPPLGSGSLFESVCIVSGVEPANAIEELMTALKAQETMNQVPFDTVTYKLDRAFTAGASLPVPMLSNLDLKAGPKLTEVQEISIKAPNVWVKVIDENRFIDILSRAAIKQTCIDQVIQQRYSVVSKAAIAQNYDISVKERAGQEFALSAAVSKGQVQMSGGGASSASIDEEIRKSSALPVVLGVDFFDTDVLKQNLGRLVTPIFDTNAITSVDAVALEGSKVVWQTQKRAPLGRTATLVERGGGQGNGCGGGAASIVDLQSSLGPSSQPAENTAAQSFELRTTGALSGGLFRTGDILTGCSAESGGVRARIHIDARVNTVVRSDAASVIQVTLVRIDESSVSVTDWKGHFLESKAGAGSDRTMSFPLSGAGAYLVQVSGTRTISASGPETSLVDERGTFKISVQ